MSKPFRTLDDADVRGKRVLLRVDLNVPTENGKVTDTTRIERVASTITEIADKPNVSIDFNHDPRSSVFHLDQTKVIDGTFVRILSWYDNEWGFSNRMSDTAAVLAKLI